MKTVILAAAVAATFGASAANAAINIYVSQTDTGVFSETIGSLNLTGLTQGSQAGGAVDSVRGGAFLYTGAFNQTFQRYTGFTGTSVLGDYSWTYASSGTGAAFGIGLQNLPDVTVYLPVGYTSGTVIDSTATYNYQTLLNMGLTLGTYTYTSLNDTITVHIGEAAPAAVPEPASWAMMVGGFGLMGAALRRRAKVSFAKA